MPTPKKTPQSQKRTAQSSKASSSKAGSSRATPGRGALPPYGVPIREAIARGDAQEMKKIAAYTRKWLSDVQSALDKLEKSMSKKRS